MKVHFTTKCIAKNYGYIYEYHEQESKEKLRKPLPLGVYSTVYRTFWDMIIRRPIQERLDMEVERRIEKLRTAFKIHNESNQTKRTIRIDEETYLGG